MEALGLGAADVFLVHDELTGQTWRWGQRAFVRLTVDDPAHVLTIVQPRDRARSAAAPVTDAAEVSPVPEPDAGGPAPAATTTAGR